MPKQKLIYVPQGCWAAITPNLSTEYQAIGTDGLQTCTGVIVKAKTQKCFFLCHASPLTDLLDRRDGIPAWIEIARQFQPIDTPLILTIYYDDQNDLIWILIDRIKHSCLPSGVCFQSWCAINNQHGAIFIDRANMIPTSFKGALGEKPDPLTGETFLIYDRKKYLIEDPPINDYIGDVITYLREQYKNTFFTDEISLGARQVEPGDALQKMQQYPEYCEKAFRPICICDGTTMCSLEITCQKYPEIAPIIEQNKCINHAEL